MVTDVIKVLENKYGEMLVTRGRKHTYVGINFDFKPDGSVDIEMKDYLKECIKEFPDEISNVVTTPAALHLFEVDDKTNKLSVDKMEIFHRIVAKLLFACKRA